MRQDSVEVGNWEPQKPVGKSGAPVGKSVYEVFMLFCDWQGPYGG